MWLTVIFWLHCYQNQLRIWWLIIKPRLGLLTSSPTRRTIRLPASHHSLHSNQSCLFSMYSELECGICYRHYTPGLRCPRELGCHHTFCESCLRALSRTPTPDEWRCGAGSCVILCPLCRESTFISSEGTIRAELRVDECVLVRLLDEGVLEREEEEEEEDPVDQVTENQKLSATTPETPAEEGESSPAHRGSRLRRSWKKVWRVISGKDSEQSSDQSKSA